MLYLNFNIHFNISFESVGVKKGDRVAIYMPMIVELSVALLACARIGAMHSIVVSIRGMALLLLKFVIDNVPH